MKKTVYFRAFEESDAELIYNWMNDDSLKKMTVGLNRRMCMDEVVDWVKARMRHDPYQVWWAVCSTETNEMIGYTCLVNIHYINSSCETGAILIGNPAYNDGFAWIESVYHLFEYAFESLGLNRVYGVSLEGHPMSGKIGELMFMQREGVLRQAAFKNGKFYDLLYDAILKDEYFAHKDAGDYEMKSIIKRLRKIRHE